MTRGVGGSRLFGSGSNLPHRDEERTRLLKPCVDDIPPSSARLRSRYVCLQGMYGLCQRVLTLLFHKLHKNGEAVCTVHLLLKLSGFRLTSTKCTMGYLLPLDTPFWFLKPMVHCSFHWGKITPCLAKFFRSIGCSDFKVCNV